MRNWRRVGLASLLGMVSLWLLPSLPAAGQTIVSQATRQLTPVAAAPPEPPFLRIDAEFHTQVVNRFAVDQGDRIIATVSDDKTIRTWRAQDGAPLATLRVPIADGYEGEIYAVAISPDGKTLLAGGYTGATPDGEFALYIFDLESQKIRGRLPHLMGPINHLAFAPDGRSFAIAMSGTAGVRLIDASNGSLIGSDDSFRKRATWVDFDVRGRMAATGLDGEVRLYDSTGKRLASRTPVAGGQPYSVAFSPDGNSIAVGYIDQPRVEVLNGRDLSARVSLQGSPSGASEAGRGGLGRVAWGRDGGLYAGGSLIGMDGGTLLRHWSARLNGRPTDRPGLRDAITQIGATDDGGVILVGADPALVRQDASGRVVFRKSSPGLDFRDMADQRFNVSVDGLSVTLQTKTMTSPWVVDMAQRTVGTGTRSLTPVAAPTSPLAPLGPPVQVVNWRNSTAPKIDGHAIHLEAEEQSRSFAVAPTQSFVALGTDYQLRIFRRDGAQTDAAPLPGATFAVGISGDARTVVAAVGDGTLRWFGLDSQGRLEARVSLFLAADGVRWVAWDQDGFFDHSDRGGKELVGLLLNQGRTKVPDWFSFAQVYRLLYSPDTIAARLRGQPKMTAQANANDLRRLLSSAPPPTVELVSVCWTGTGGQECRPMAPSATSRGLHTRGTESVDASVPADVKTVSVRYRLISDIAGKSPVDLFVNGRNSGRALREATNAATARDREIEQSAPVEAGINHIQLRAYDRDQLTYAQSRVVEVGRAQPAAATAAVETSKPKLFILSVGIDHYPPTINSLNFAVADARSVARAIRAHVPPGYSGVELIELYDADASAANVLKALASIGAKAAEADTVLIYLSGHGATIDKHYYFITQNVTSVESVPQTAVSESALVRALAGIQARNSLVFLDTCHAGAFSLDSASQIAHETGRYVLAAAASVEEALDSYDNRNGVFATAVLRGLAGGAASGNHDTVSNFDLGLFVTPLVHQLAVERHHNQSARFKIAAEDAQPFAIVEVAQKPGATP